MSSKTAATLQPHLEELKYWNHGDNPAFKKFMKIATQNTRGKCVIDHRTHVIDRGVRLSLARNFDDFIQRDLKAHTFPRAFAVWIISSLFLYRTYTVTKRLLPIGRYGIRNVTQTQFYHNFGYPGVVLAGAGLGFAAYAWWKFTRFTVHKFYRHVIQQNRNWVLQNLQVSRYGNYNYPQSILTSEDSYSSSKEKKEILGKYPAQQFSYSGPYGVPPAK